MTDTATDIPSQPTPEGAADATKQMADAARKRANAAADKASELAGEAREALGEYAEKAGEALSEAAGKAGVALGEAADKAGDAIAEATQTAMTRLRNNAELPSERGHTVIANEVVEKIAGIAAREVPGVYDLGGDVARIFTTIKERLHLGDESKAQGVGVKLSGRTAEISVTLVLEYGFVVSSVTDKVREKVISSVEALLELDVTAVDILVDDIHIETAGPVGDDTARAATYDTTTKGVVVGSRGRTRVNVAITGGARGIGLATARAFAASGADVIIGDIDLAVAETAAAGIGARAVELDVRDPASFDAFVASAGAIDVLVNNAGVAHGASFLDTPAGLRDLQIDINLRGVMHGMAAALPGMIARGRGHVVNVASLAGRIATPNAAVYTATKFAVVGLTEAVRAEVRGTGVRLTAVLPTFIHTEMTAGLPLDGIPTAEPDDVARAILRAVRRSGPAVVTVPRWLGGLPRMAAFTPQFLQDRMRHSATKRAVEEGPKQTSAYAQRVRDLIDPPVE